MATCPVCGGTDLSEGTGMTDFEITNRDGAVTVTLRLGLEITERLVNILAGYTEMQEEKVGTMEEYGDEYTPEDVAAAEANLATAHALFPVIVKAYSEGVAAAVTNEEDR